MHEHFRPATTMRDATLILGGGGFIGTRLCATLQSMATPLSVLSHGIEDADTAAVVQRRGSVEDTGLLRELIENCTSVVYLASITTPGTSAREPTLEVTGNLLPLAQFLEVAQTLAPRKLIFISSGGTVYGNHADGANESTMLRPRSFYGAGKVASEAMLHAFAVHCGWPTIVLRPTNVYGPGQLPIKGFAVVPTIFRHILERSVFEIWGDGSVVRDYLFIDDLCALITHVIDSAAAEFSVYNIGSGSSVSILELVTLCEQAAGMALKTAMRPARTVDVSRAVLDVGAVARAYDWQAATPLRTGLQLTWQWLKNFTAAT